MDWFNFLDYPVNVMSLSIHPSSKFGHIETAVELIDGA